MDKYEQEDEKVRDAMVDSRAGKREPANPELDIRQMTLEAEARWHKAMDDNEEARKAGKSHFEGGTYRWNVDAATQKQVQESVHGVDPDVAAEVVKSGVGQYLTDPNGKSITDKVGKPILVSHLGDPHEKPFFLDGRDTHVLSESNGFDGKGSIEVTLNESGSKAYVHPSHPVPEHQHDWLGSMVEKAGNIGLAAFNMISGGETVHHDHVPNGNTVNGNGQQQSRETGGRQ